MSRKPSLKLLTIIEKEQRINIFHDIFKCRENFSNYIFSEVHNSLLRIMKSEYFAKKVIFSECPPHKL